MSPEYPGLGLARVEVMKKMDRRCSEKQNDDIPATRYCVVCPHLYIHRQDGREAETVDQVSVHVHRNDRRKAQSCERTFWKR